jgi:hypothetical protein
LTFTFIYDINSFMPNIRKKIINLVAISSLVLGGFNALPALADNFTWTRIQVSAVSGGSATISWSTNVPVTGVVRFGLNQNSLTSFLGDSRLQTDHETKLVGLQESKQYFFAITARASDGTEITSFIFNFTTTKFTQQEKDERANNQPVVEGNGRVGVDGISATVAAVSWQGNANTSGFITWNIPGKKSSRYNVGLRLDHQVLMSHLKPNTLYEYTVTMKDSNKRVVAVRGPFNFTTLDSVEAEKQPLTINYLGPASTNDSRLSPTTAAVTFTTNHLSKTTVTYRATTDRKATGGTVKPMWYAYGHTVPLTNLKPNTSYTVNISTSDPFGHTAKLTTVSFRTPATATAVTPSPTPTPRVSGIATGPDSNSGWLAKTPTNPAVYYIYPSGRKKIFLTEAVFYSYGHNFRDVRVISASELANYPDVRLIKTKFAPTVYAFEPIGRDGSSPLLHPILTADAFIRAGYKWDEIELANPTDVQSYPVDGTIT